ncbi:MAG: cytochrome P450 [Deltaproteobacteria bacterium]|nr:cytochrome P450 [Deltaproteobacteria bacterium]MBI3391107.1 cytochrome P450 [Deltaproteobacteria bacterium]
MSLPSYAIDDPDFYLDDVETAYRRLRNEAPVYWCERAGFWALTKYADIDHVSRNAQLFCSGQGVLVKDPMRDGTMPDQPQSIIYMDSPAHLRYRRLVSKAFTPRMVKELEPRIRQYACESLDAVTPGVPIDFVEQVAVPLPMIVIAEMLGVPKQDRADFKRWSDAIIAGADLGVMSTMVTVQELFGYFLRVLEERRRVPREDLISALAVAEVDGERLADDEVLMFCLTLLVAGNETTRNLIAGGARALMQFPDERRTLAADPALLPRAIDEMLRWVTPVKTFARTATQDTMIRGQRIAAGDYVVLLYASANRDEEVWGPTADRFDVTRATDSDHLSFGIGPHSCLGANLAQLEGCVLFEELLARFPDFAPAGEVEVLRSTIMNGIVRMPVVFAST